MDKTILDGILNQYLAQQKMSEYAKDYGWLNRAITTPFRTKDNESVRTESFESDGIHYVVPRVRMTQSGELVTLGKQESFDIAMQYNDGIPFNTKQEADNFSMELSHFQGRRPRIGQFAPKLNKDK